MPAVGNAKGKVKEMKQNSGYKNILFKFTAFVALAIMLSGCGKHYKRIPYAWTSDHRLPPHERILSLKASPLSTFTALQKWVKDNHGSIVSSVDDYRYVYDLQPQSEEHFQTFQTFVQKYWQSFDENTFLKWDNAEWTKLKELSDLQINKTKSDTAGFVLEVAMGDRTGTFTYSKQVGTKQSFMPIYNPGFTAYQPPPGPGSKTMRVPGPKTMVPMSTPTYEKRTKTLRFHSSISFFIYRHDAGTHVYAIGMPVDEKGVRSSYHGTIGHAWWPQVTGKKEASLIKEAYTFLSELDKAGELEKFGAGITAQAEAKSSSLKVSKRLIAEISDSTILNSTFTVSPDSKRLVYVSAVGNKRSVVVDGKEEKQYDGIGKGYPIFSPDNNHVAYSARTGNKWFVVVDGKEEKQYNDIGAGTLIFSPDSNHVAYSARTGNKCLTAIMWLIQQELAINGLLSWMAKRKNNTIAP
jgi:hypothetical protein